MLLPLPGGFWFATIHLTDDKGYDYAQTVSNSGTLKIVHTSYQTWTHTKVIREYVGASYIITVPLEIGLYIGSGAEPVCAMKTTTAGYFYVPNVATDLLKIEMLFDNQNIVGDQIGGTSPYSTITAYPDGKVDICDVAFVSSKFGLVEGRSGWDYMADVYPDRKIDIQDKARVSANFGKFGTYITSLAGVTVTFNTGQTISPDSYGFVTIPQGATSFTVKRNGTLIGAMIIFW